MDSLGSFANSEDRLRTVGFFSSLLVVAVRFCDDCDVAGTYTDTPAMIEVGIVALFDL